VSSVTGGVAGVPVALNLASVERTLIDDSRSGWEVGASFAATKYTTNITFTAATVTGASLSPLQNLLPSGATILDCWSFSATNFTASATNPVYLSFNVGGDHPADDLSIWRYNGTAWSPFVPTDLTYDGSFASFTTTALGTYAVVPEPGTLALLATGVLGLLAYAWRKRR
jgi:hypothetical protein